MIEEILTAIFDTVCPNVYQSKADDDVQFPCIVFTRTETVPQNDISGWTGLAQVQFQVDVYDLTQMGSLQLAVDARNALFANLPTALWVNQTNEIDDTTSQSLFRTLMVFDALVEP